jgi:hypothetical protein
MTAADPERAADHPAGDLAATAGDPAPKPTRMLRFERQIGAVVAGVLIAGVVASWAGDIAAGKSQALAYGAIGLALAAVLAAAIRYGHRVITSFASLAAGVTPLAKSLTYISIAALGYGTWLMFRSSRAQAQARAASGTRRPPRQRRQQRGKDATRGGDDAGRRPKANRRYTPPKTKKTPGIR